MDSTDLLVCVKADGRRAVKLPKGDMPYDQAKSCMEVFREVADGIEEELKKRNRGTKWAEF